MSKAQDLRDLLIKAGDKGIPAERAHEIVGTGINAFTARGEAMRRVVEGETTYVINPKFAPGKTPAKKAAKKAAKKTAKKPRAPKAAKKGTTLRNIADRYTKAPDPARVALLSYVSANRLLRDVIRDQVQSIEKNATLCAALNHVETIERAVEPA